MMNFKYLSNYSIFIFNENIQYKYVSHQSKFENVLDQALKHVIAWCNLLQKQFLFPYSMCRFDFCVNLPVQIFFLGSVNLCSVTSNVPGTHWTFEDRTARAILFAYSTWAVTGKDPLNLPLFVSVYMTQILSANSELRIQQMDRFVNGWKVSSPKLVKLPSLLHRLFSHSLIS